MSLPSISVLIITYNRPEDTLALIEDLYHQNNWKEHLSEVQILNNNSEKSYHSLLEWMEQNPDFPINYIDHSENLGVARGRNYLFKKAQGDYWLLIDDDMLIKGQELFNDLVAITQDEFIIQNNVAITSMNVHYYETKAPQISAFPHKKYDKYKNQSQFLTYYFPGGAHLLKASIIEKVGLYPEDFFYGMEEYDFAFRVLDAGWNIAYDDRVILWHKESPTGRLPRLEQWMMMWENKCRVAHKYLPRKYYLTTYWMWMFHLLKIFKNPIPILKKAKEIPKVVQNEKTQKISKATLRKLKRLEARLYY